MPMALYKHVANKDELLDGMVDVVVGEIDPPRADADWKSAVRQRILVGAAGAAAPPLGRRGDRVANHADAGRAGLHGLDDRDVPRRRLLRRPHPPRHARPGQPHVGVHPGAVPRPAAAVDPASAGGHVAASWPGGIPHIVEMATAAPHDERRRSSARAATTSSSSSSRSISCWTGSTGSSSRGGRPRDNAASAERVTRIELALSAWEADVLPLNYTRERARAYLADSSAPSPAHSSAIASRSAVPSGQRACCTRNGPVASPTSTAATRGRSCSAGHRRRRCSSSSRRYRAAVAGVGQDQLEQGEVREQVGPVVDPVPAPGGVDVEQADYPAVVDEQLRLVEVPVHRDGGVFAGICRG